MSNTEDELMQVVGHVSGALRSQPRAIVAGVILAASLLSSGLARAQQQFEGLPPAPGTSGDQLLFFYDVRPDRQTFLSVGNTSPQTGITLEIVFYSQEFDARIAEQVIVVPGGGATIIDPTQAQGVSGNAGLATVTPIVSESDHTPVVPPRPLQGSFTIVNTTLGAGFGDNAFGRLALQGAPGAGQFPRANAGDAVDGQNTFYQGIQPNPQGTPSLTLPAYFNPETLAPPDVDGNRVLLAAFRDEYAAPVGPGNSPRFNLRSITNSSLVSFYNSGNGQRIVTNRQVSVSGVELDSLQSLAGLDSFTSGGRLELTVGAFNSAQESFFGTYSQSLGTFAGGARLVPVDIP